MPHINCSILKYENIHFVAFMKEFGTCLWNEFIFLQILQFTTDIQLYVKNEGHLILNLSLDGFQNLYEFQTTTGD